MYIYLCINTYIRGGAMGGIKVRKLLPLVWGLRFFAPCCSRGSRCREPAGPGLSVSAEAAAGAAAGRGRPGRRASPRPAAAPRSPGTLREKAGFCKRITRSSRKVAACCGGDTWKLPDLSFLTAFLENSRWT